MRLGIREQDIVRRKLGSHDEEDVSAVQMGEREGMIQVQLAEILFCESLEHVSV